MSLTIALDFDSTIAEPAQGGRLRLRAGAAEAIRAFKSQGHRLVLHSCRCNPMDDGPLLDNETAGFYSTGIPAARVTEQWARFDEMRAFLAEQGLWPLFDNVWQAPGKPLADLYVDDKAERPDWMRLMREMGVGAAA